MDYTNSERKDNSVTFFVIQSGHRITPCSLFVSCNIVSEYSSISFFIQSAQAVSKNMIQHNGILCLIPFQNHR